MENNIDKTFEKHIKLLHEKLDYGKEQSESTNIQESSHGDPDDKNKPFDGITAQNRLNYIDNIVFTYPDKSLEWYKKKILDGSSFQDYKKLTTYELFNLKRLMSSFKDKDTSSDDLKENVSLKDGDIYGTLIVQGQGQDGQETPSHEFEVEFSVNIKYPDVESLAESGIYYNKSNIIEQVESAIVNGLKNGSYSIEG